jgi:hypothetical protein
MILFYLIAAIVAFGIYAVSFRLGRRVRLTVAFTLFAVLAGSMTILMSKIDSPPPGFIPVQPNEVYPGTTK